MFSTDLYVHYCPQICIFAIKGNSSCEQAERAEGLHGRTVAESSEEHFCANLALHSGHTSYVNVCSYASSFHLQN